MEGPAGEDSATKRNMSLKTEEGHISYTAVKAQLNCAWRPNTRTVNLAIVAGQISKQLVEGLISFCCLNVTGRDK